jgi:hypothetical protein
MTLRPFLSDHQSPGGPLWPTTEEYALAHTCPRCKAAPGDACVIRGGPAGRTIHLPRQDRGVQHYYRDVGHAPWPEERVPGNGTTRSHGSSERVLLVNVPTCCGAIC